MVKANEALDAIAKKRLNRNDTQHECTLYGQLVASKLEKLPKRSRVILMNQIDNLIFQAELQEIDNNQRPSSQSTFTDQTSPSCSVLSPVPSEPRSIVDYYCEASDLLNLQKL